VEPDERLRDRARREISAIDEALAAGVIDDSGWHDAIAALVRPAYLAAPTPWGQSGKSGGEADWIAARRIVMAAVAPSWTAAAPTVT
jgi:hypothetical protein